MYKINNRDLLYRTENYIQYLEITYNGKESKNKEYMKPSHFVVHLILTQYCKSTILQLKKKILNVISNQGNSK